MNRQIIVFIFVLLVGCASTDFKSTYTSAITKIKGEYYLDSEKYDKGVTEFELILKENPENVDLLWKLGRTTHALTKEIKKILQESQIVS